MADTTTMDISKLPDEIHLQIFEAVCALELIGRSMRLPIPPPHSIRRKLKPPLRPISQVCSLWRGLVLGHPPFWITMIIIFGSSDFQERIRAARLVLADSHNSDIDVLWSFHPDHKSETLSFLEELIYQNKTRIRVLEAMYFPSNTRKQLMEQLGSSIWPRLRALRIESAEHLWASPPVKIWAPDLLSVHVIGPHFDGDFPFSGLSTLRLSNDLWPPDPTPTSSLWPIQSLHKIILPSAQNISTLNIVSASLSGDLPTTQLHLPRLSRLSLNYHTLQHLVIFASSIETPMLSELSLSLRYKFEAYSVELPDLQLKFESVTRAVFRLPARCYPPLFRCLQLNNVADAVVQASHTNINDSLNRPNPDYIPRFTFPKLRNLLLDWSQLSHHHEQLSWFLTYFDFRCTGLQIDLSLGYMTPRERLLIPHASKFSCRENFDDLQHVTMPSLRHLQLKKFYPSTVQQTANKLRKVLYAPLSNVETLELGAWILYQQFDYTDFVQLIPRVTKLIIKPPFFNHSGPDDPQFSLEGSFWSTTRDKPFLPQLRIIEVVCRDWECARKIPQHLIDLTREFILCRKEQGYPISTIRFDNGHSNACFKINPADRQWFQENVDNVRLFDYEDEFAWYSTYYPYLYEQ
jgi:hypothetical protein